MHIHYNLKHFVHGTQCVFSKLMQDESGNTALIKACADGRVETARVLLDNGANVDHQKKVKLETRTCTMMIITITLQIPNNFGKICCQIQVVSITISITFYNGFV